MRFSILGSGSSGNATWVELDGLRLLLDCGLSLKETEKRLQRIGRSVDQLDAVLVTHEHEDHARGLESLLRRRRVVVASTRGTLRALRPALPSGTDCLELRAGVATSLGPLQVAPFRIPHDAAEPVGFRLESAGSSLGHLTDFGRMTDEIREGIAGLSTIIIESNHDVELLRTGPYPARLKKRILGPYGHISNEAIHEWLRDAELSGCELLYLAHLSRTNNRPDLATASAALALAGRAQTPEIKISTAFEPTPIEIATGRGATPPALRIEATGAAPHQLQFRFEEAPN